MNLISVLIILAFEISLLNYFIELTQKLFLKISFKNIISKYNLHFIHFNVESFYSN